MNITLDKNTKTIRIVNRDGKLKLSKKNNVIKVVNRRKNVRLTHTGKAGPVGPTGVSTFVRAHHRDNASYSRPNATFVEWVGSTAPLNATEEDTWIHTPVIA